MSHVVNPNTLRLGTYSLNWAYSHKFSEITKIFKLHLELNFLLTQFLKIYGINLVKYHISFEHSGLRLSLIIFRYTNYLSNQRVFSYLKEDVRSLNNPFSSSTNTTDYSSTVTDTRFLSHKRVLTRLRLFGFRRDSRRWSKQNYTWYWKGDSVFEQQVNHPNYKLKNSFSKSSKLSTFIKNKFLYYLDTKRAFLAHHTVTLLRSRKRLNPLWFEKFEKFSRYEFNLFYRNCTGRSKIKWATKKKKIKLFRRFLKKFFKSELKRLMLKWSFKKSRPVKNKKVFNTFLLSTFLRNNLKRNNLIFFLMHSLGVLNRFFFIKNMFYSFLVLKSYKCAFLKKNQLKKVNTATYSKKNNLNCAFKKKYLSFTDIRNKNYLFFNNWSLNKQSNVNLLNTHLKNKLLMLSLNYLLIDRFNQIFLVNLYSASNMFKNEKIREDLYRNVFLVKKWALPKVVKHFNYFYFILLLSIRLRITGPISSFVSVFIGKTVFHYKTLFCLKNIMSDLKIRSPQLSLWKGTVIDAVGRVNGSDRKKYCRYSSTRMFPLSTFDTIVNQSQRRAISKYGLVNIKVLTFWRSY